jgi:hypothetical protein
MGEWIILKFVVLNIVDDLIVVGLKLDLIL